MEKFLKYQWLIAVIGALIIILYGLKMWMPSPLWQSQTPTDLPDFPAVVVVQPEKPTPTAIPVTVAPSGFQYVEVIDGCGPYFIGPCVNMRSGPGMEYPVVMHLRNGMVLKVLDTVVHDGRAWYKIMFDEGVRYPERITGDWYVAADYVELFTDEGDQHSSAEATATNTKRIIVDLSEERLYAYDGDTLFMEEPISTGLEFTPTPRGTFTVYKKTPSRYMQGPIPDISDQYFDLPGVPWDLYFTYEGAVIHGAYWHDKFGSPWSHGCVNLPPQKAKELYQWADVGTPVIVRN